MFDFSGLFVLDLANNHQGDVAHGLDVIRAMGRICREKEVRGVFKFQFRDLDTFIHRDHLLNSGNKHVSRFLSTKLSLDDFKRMFDEVKAEGLLAMCTPFDETSVDVVCEMGFDLIKVASCSAADWPLIESVADAGLPTIVSTGGLSFSGIDDLVSFFSHRNADFALMHCVSLYPTPDDRLNLSAISSLRERFPALSIGWSTHENPDDILPVQLAAAQGAVLFERHVGISTDKHALNSYSSTPQQVGAWIEAYKRARVMLGQGEKAITDEETSSIDDLTRGIYLKNAVPAGSPIQREDVYFAMPLLDGQIPSGQWRSNIISRSNVESHEPLLAKDTDITFDHDVMTLKKIIHDVKAILNKARIFLSPEFAVEYSHHYGVSRFHEYGAVIINCINREYCKKIIVQIPGQQHPSHYHRLKEETFQVLFGTLIIWIDGRERVLHPGDTCLVLPGVWHSFRTDTGCVVEEISTTHYNSDSVYKDPKINDMAREERKTIVDHWGRFQIPLRIKRS